MIILEKPSEKFQKAFVQKLSMLFIDNDWSLSLNLLIAL